MEEERQFLCGVVEGFYGRPWSMDQRKVLFQWYVGWHFVETAHIPSVQEVTHRVRTPPSY